MLHRPAPRHPGRLAIALALSLILHGILLALTPRTPLGSGPPAQTMQARLQPRPAEKPAREVQPKPPAPPKPEKPPAKTPPKVRRPESTPRILTAREPAPGRVAPSDPKWTVAQKEDMNKFLDELATEARSRPSLAERSLAMARDIGRQQERRNDDAYDLVERRPNSPEIDPLSLDMYMDALVKKLNRSASFVRNDPRTRGVQSASVLVRISPDGRLESFRVLKVADQQAEIDFTRSVVQQAAPFSAFPPDINRSAKSLALLICIRPPSLAGGAFGFSRMTGERGCN